MKQIVKFVIITMFGALLFSAVPAKANWYGYRVWSDRYNDVYERNYLQNYDYVYPSRSFARNVFIRSNQFDYLNARRVVIVDRDFDRRLVLRNSLTGPFSRNEIVVRTDSDLYDRLYSNVYLTRDVTVDVDTGGNRVSFNTVVGDISSGDVDISIW